MSAQISSRRVAADSAAKSRLVRPQDSAPLTSVRQPRGKPPVSASTCWIPLEAISGEGRISRCEAAVIPACGDLRASSRKRAADFASQTPGTPCISIGNSGEAMRDPQIWKQGGRSEELSTFAFYSPTDSKILLPLRGLVNRVRKRLKNKGLGLGGEISRRYLVALPGIEPGFED